jgi:hypothetical protein
MIIIVMCSGDGHTPWSNGSPECTTLLTLLPVFLSQPGAGFFFIPFFPSYFELWGRWLHSVTRITYLCKLIGIPSFAAFPQLKLFRENI